MPTAAADHRERAACGGPRRPHFLDVSRKVYRALGWCLPLGEKTREIGKRGGSRSIRPTSRLVPFGILQILKVNTMIFKMK